MSEPVELFRGSELREGDSTDGIHRKEAFHRGVLWAGLVHTDPGGSSGWHHHGDYETSLYVVAGSMRVEFGSRGATSVEAGPGDFVRVPPRTVHRELNPGAGTSTAVIGRAGHGKTTENVAHPDE